MVGGHLRAAHQRQSGALGVRTRSGDYIAWLDQCRVAALTLRQDFLGPLAEFVYIELIVGEQHEVLEVLGRRGRVMLQAMQGIVDPGRSKGDRKSTRLNSSH